MPELYMIYDAKQASRIGFSVYSYECSYASHVDYLLVTLPTYVHAYSFTCVWRGRASHNAMHNDDHTRKYDERIIICSLYIFSHEQLMPYTLDADQYCNTINNQ